jgi:outer membrane immunogenic protein
MKKLLLSMAITAGFTGAALAADLPAKAPYMAPAPVVGTNWTGCYIGAGGGYGMWNQEHSTLDPTRIPFRNQLGTATTGGRGWFGTVQAGCDYQFAPRWVVGVFGDWDFGSLSGNYSPAILSNTGALGQEKMKNSWAAGARVGYLVLPQLLGYVSGGYTQARFDAVSMVTNTPGTTFLQDAQTYNGWFLGSGYEYALDLLPGLFWKTEYRFSTYQNQQPGISLISATGTTPFGFEDSKKYVQTIRSELVYRFNWGGGPVVARY